MLLDAGFRDRLSIHKSLRSFDFGKIKFLAEKRFTKLHQNILAGSEHKISNFVVYYKTFLK